MRLARHIVMAMVVLGLSARRCAFSFCYQSMRLSSTAGVKPPLKSVTNAQNRRLKAKMQMALKNARGPLKPMVQDLPKMNEQIKAPELRVLIDRGDQPDEALGVISRKDALQRAEELGLDLVLMTDKNDPPVCKIVDYGKLRYAKEKKKKEQMKKAKSNEIKEVKMSYKIGEADYQVRRKAALKFINNGMRVKLVIQFRGREQQHINLGDDLIARFISELEEEGAPVQKTSTVREGRDLATILSAKS